MDQPTLLGAAALAVGTIALALALSAHRRLLKARRGLALLQAGAPNKTILEAVAAYSAELGSLREAVGVLDGRQQDVFAALSQSPRRIAIVRYDAFEDMGGRMSFSAAIVDDHGTGLVLTSINGRTEARTYAKTVEAGGSDHNLSPEEKEAIAKALGEKTKARRAR